MTQDRWNRVLGKVTPWKKTVQARAEDPKALNLQLDYEAFEQVFARRRLSDNPLEKKLSEQQDAILLLYHAAYEKDFLKSSETIQRIVKQSENLLGHSAISNFMHQRGGAHTAYKEFHTILLKKQAELLKLCSDTDGAFCIKKDATAPLAGATYASLLGAKEPDESTEKVLSTIKIVPKTWSEEKIAAYNLNVYRLAKITTIVQEFEHMARSALLPFMQSDHLKEALAECERLEKTHEQLSQLLSSMPGPLEPAQKETETENLEEKGAASLSTRRKP